MELSDQELLHDRDLESFLARCAKIISPQKDVEYYSCVGLCALDAVFSIRANYFTTVSPLIDRFCELFGFNRSAPHPSSIPEPEEQVPISIMRGRLDGFDAIRLADSLKNRQKTSSRNGILKAQAFLEYLEVFERYNIETFQDVNRLADNNPNFEESLRKIRGQNVSVDYFFMLAGDKDRVKVDIHLRRFVKETVGRELNYKQIISLLHMAVLHLRENGYPEMTARQLDHIVWSWQRVRRTTVNKAM